MALNNKGAFLLIVVIKNLEWSSSFILAYVSIAGLVAMRRENGKSWSDIYGFYLDVTHVTFTHISLADAHQQPLLNSRGYEHAIVYQTDNNQE